MLQPLFHTHKALPVIFKRSITARSVRKILSSDQISSSSGKKLLDVAHQRSFASEHYQVKRKQTVAPPELHFFKHDVNDTGNFNTQRIQLKLDDGKRKTIPNLWLRDNCHCEKCVNSETMQRAFDTFSIPENIAPDDVVSEKDGLRVTWPDGDKKHISFYPWSWIMKNLSACQQQRKLKTEISSYTLWDSDIEFKEPSVDYDEIMATDLGVGKWTSKIRKFGFCYVDGCPILPEKTKSLIERISFIRETHYGGFYDFTSDLMMKDTAYTTLALAPHTDTTYFTDPAGLQMFHLLSHEHGSGGSSILIDGFNAANLLKKESRAYYDILSSKSVHAHAVGNEGITIKPARTFPVLGLRNSSTEKEKLELYQIRWNNDDRGTVPLENENNDLVDMWYAAARRFNEILKMESMQYKTQLKPGRPLIFDNWRVLHGRTAFTGQRRICGGYVNHDDYMSRWYNTNYTRQQLLEEIL